jgi:hypothetical protein
VRWDHNVRPLETGVSREGLQQLVPLVDVVNVVFEIRDIDPPELDPSPALGGDDPDIAWGEGFAELIFTCEDCGKGDFASQTEDEVARVRDILSPATPEDERRIARSFVKGPLGRLDNVDRRSPSEGLLGFRVVNSAVPGDHHLGEATW